MDDDVGLGGRSVGIAGHLGSLCSVVAQDVQLPSPSMIMKMIPSQLDKDMSR
jgi:hypothetical protein